MAKVAYRLYTIKAEEKYVEAGFTFEEASAIIEYAYDEDEDFLNKKSYINYAKKVAQRATEELRLSKPLNWKVLFGEPKAEYGWRYCSKCDTFFWDGEPCECE